jgi:O-antigen/teichoic acid export membrane protein
MSGSILLGGVLLFVSIVLVARYLGAAQFGDFVLVLTVVSLFQLFADGGIVNITIRDIARDRDSASEIAGHTQALVWVISLGVAALVVLVVALLAPPPEMRAVIYLMGLAALFALHASVYAAIVRAYEDMELISGAAFLHKVAVLGLVYLSIRLDSGIAGIALAHLAANLLNWLFFLVLVNRRYLRPRLRWTPDRWSQVLRESVPLGAGMLLRRMTVHLGTVLLAVLATSAAVGLYNSAYRVLQMAEIAAIGLVGVLFPTLSRLSQASVEDFRRLFRDSLRILIFISASLGAWFLVLGHELMALVYGPAFREAGPSLGLLGLAMAFVVPGTLFHVAFSVLGEQRRFMALTAMGLLLNGLLNLVLIPWLGSTGAALATLGSEVVMFATMAVALQRLALPGDYLRVYPRAALAATAATLPLWLVPADAGAMPLVLASASFGLAYLLVALALGVLSSRELAFVSRLVRR